MGIAVYQNVNKEIILSAEDRYGKRLEASLLAIESFCISGLP